LALAGSGLLTAGITGAAAQRAPAAVLSGKPNNLVWKAGMPHGPAPLRQSKPPAKTLLVLDIEHLSADWQRAALSLQGIVNRTKPEIYCIQSDMDEVWLKRMVGRGWVKGTQRVNAPADLVKRFQSRLRGVIVTDPGLPASVNVAFTAASVENALVVSPSIAETLGMKTVLDTRGKWATNAEAYSWAFDTYWPRLNHELLAVLDPRTLSPRDYMVENKGFCFWITGPVDGADEHASPTAEAVLMERLLARMPVNIPVLGYPYAGEGVGIAETSGVSLFAKFGKYLIATDFDANMSVHSGIPVTSFRQAHPPAPKLDQKNVYVSFIVSDGDNLQVYQQHSFPDMWRSSERGTIPIGWSLSPSAARLVPGIADWFYRAATPNDEFVGAVSGVGYTYPDDYAERYEPASRRRVWEGFLSQTAASMKQMDMRDLWIMGATRAALYKDYAEAIPGLNALYPDYGRQVTEYADATFPTAKGVPVFRASTNWTGATQAERVRNAVQEIRAIVPTTRPAFLHVFAQNWQVDVPTLKALAKALGPDYVPVRPDHLGALYRQYLKSQQIILTGPKELNAIEGHRIRMSLSACNVTSTGFSAKASATGPLRPATDRWALAPYQPNAITLQGLPGLTNSVSVFTLKYPGGALRHKSSIRVTPKSEIVGEIPPGALRAAGRWDAIALPHRSGTAVPDKGATSGMAWAVDPAMTAASGPGHVVYGPYTVCPPGRYIALFRIKRTGPGQGPIAHLDASVAGGEQPLVQRPVTAEEAPVGKYISVALPFEYPGGKLETRVESLGTAAIAIDCISLYQIQ
jgi:hypothetical protein